MPLDGHQVVLQVAVRIRIAVREVDGVIVVLELDVEGERVRASLVIVVAQGAVNKWRDLYMKLSDFL